MVNTEELRNRIQSEIDKHLAVVATLEQKLALIGQVENLANEMASISGDSSYKAAAAPDPKSEESSGVSAPAEQPAGGELPAKDGPTSAAQNLWALMHQAFQTYLSGKLDKALQLFLEARELNPVGFDKTWTTMTSIPAYAGVARDKYFTESLFAK